MEIYSVLTLQKGLALLPLFPQILQKNFKNIPNSLSALCFKTLNKLEQRIFEIKSIPLEYFEDLLSRNIYKTDFVGDLKSCALLSVNSLFALSGTSKSWIELRQFDPTDEINFKVVSNTNTLQLFDKNEDPYLIQCYAVSSIERGFVIYVTNEKYLNILEHFNMNIITGPVCKVKVKNSKVDVHPLLAKDLALGYIEPAVEIETDNVKHIVETFFQTPKHLKMNQVFQVNLKNISPGAGIKNFNIENLYFKVLDIAGKSDKRKEDTVFYVYNKYTEIKLVSKTQGFLPPVCTKYVPLKGRLGYEIPVCPTGLEKYYSKLKKLFETVLSGEFKCRPMILLTGVKGSGKKTILKCITSNFGLKLFTVNCFDFIGLSGSTLEAKFQGLMSKLQKLAPAVLYMDNIGLLGRDEQYRECLPTIEIFRKQVDRLLKNDLKYPVIIVASSNQKVMDIIPSVHRMFIQTISFEAPKKEETFLLLKWLVNEVGMTCLNEVLETVVDKVNGYLFADLSKLIRLTLMFQREDPNLSEECRLLLSEDHWEKGIKIMDGLYSDSIGSAKVPSVHWDDIGGLDNLKEEITLALEFPTKCPQLMASGLKASGFLFYGPPGTGKTLMAKAVATEFNYNFLSVKGPELMNMYVGQSEKNVREVFQRARDAAPCVIFFDELDSLAPNRGRNSSMVTDRIVSQLLTEMDGLESNKGIFIIGATNRPDLLDPALLRPGRFDKMFYVGVCESIESKFSVIKALTKRFSLGHDVDLKCIVEYLPDQVTGADIYSICSNAWLEAARKHINGMNKGEELKLPITVNLDDFQKALSNFVPSLTPDIVGYYDAYRNTGK